MSMDRRERWTATVDGENTDSGEMSHPERSRYEKLYVFVLDSK